MVTTNFISCKVENTNDIMKADKEQLLNIFNDVMNFDHFESGPMTKSDKNLVTYLLNIACRDDSGRLILPCLWDKQVEHCLPNNFNLAFNILKSTVKKLSNNVERLNQYDHVVKEQLKTGIIEKVDNLEQLKYNKNVNMQL